MPKSPSLHHLALGSVDPDGLARFYVDVLQLREVMRHHYDDGSVRSVWLDLGGPILMIEHVELSLRDDRAMRPGLFLLAVGIDDDDREEWEARLADAGSPVEDRTRYTSYARDPEGNRFALSSYEPSW